MAAIMPMMATTSNSSISENPCGVSSVAWLSSSKNRYVLRKKRGRESELCPRHVLVGSWYLVTHRNPSGPDSRCVVGWRRIADLCPKDTVFSNGETAIAGSGNRGHIRRVGGRVEGGRGTYIQVTRGTQEGITALKTTAEH